MDINFLNRDAASGNGRPAASCFDSSKCRGRCCRNIVLLSIALFATSIFAGADELQTVKVAHWGHEKILIYAPLYIAMDGGFFERQGLNIELVYSGNDDQVFATVLSGEAQFGVGDPAFTAVSREKGGEGKVVAGLVGRVANWGVTNNSNVTPFSDANNLDGLQVSSFPAPSTTYTILTSIKQDLDLASMEVKQIAFGSEQAALERGEVDLAIMLEPQASIAVSRGLEVVWSLADYYGDFALTGVTTTDSYIKDNPQTVQRLVNGLQNALGFCAKSPEAAAVILTESFPNLRSDIVKSAMARMVSDETIPRSVTVEREAWLKTLRLRQEIGDLESLGVASECIDMTFASRANSFSSPTVSAENDDAGESTNSAPAKDFLGWGGDAASIISFGILVFTFAVIIRKLRGWDKLTDADRECGPAIANCLPHPAAKASEADLIRAIMADQKRTEQAATKSLQNFRHAGLLKTRNIKGTILYMPVVNWLTDSCPLLELWKN